MRSSRPNKQIRVNARPNILGIVYKVVGGVSRVEKVRRNLESPTWDYLSLREALWLLSPENRTQATTTFFSLISDKGIRTDKRLYLIDRTAELWESDDAQRMLSDYLTSHHGIEEDIIRAIFRVCDLAYGGVGDHLGPLKLDIILPGIQALVDSQHIHTDFRQTLYSYLWAACLQSEPGTHSEDLLRWMLDDHRIQILGNFPVLPLQVDWTRRRDSGNPPHTAQQIAIAKEWLSRKHRTAELAPRWFLLDLFASELDPEYVRSYVDGLIKETRQNTPILRHLIDSSCKLEILESKERMRSVLETLLCGNVMENVSDALFDLAKEFPNDLPKIPSNAGYLEQVQSLFNVLLNSRIPVESRYSLARLSYFWQIADRRYPEGCAVFRQLFDNFNPTDPLRDLLGDLVLYH